MVRPLAFSFSASVSSRSEYVAVLSVPSVPVSAVALDSVGEAAEDTALLSSVLAALLCSVCDVALCSAVEDV